MLIKSVRLGRNRFDGDEFRDVRGSVGELSRNEDAVNGWFASNRVGAMEGVYSKLLVCVHHGDDEAVDEADEYGVMVLSGVEPLGDVNSVVAVL